MKVEKVKEHFNELYSEFECYWSSRPTLLVRKVAKLLSKDAEILDLGCGEGRNTLYLARQGFKRCMGVDISEEAIKKAKETRDKEGLMNAEFILGDIRNFPFSPTKYDCILAISSLHFLEKNEGFEVLEKMKEYTKDGGYNVVYNLSSRDRRFFKDPKAFLINAEDLLMVYRDWEILELLSGRELSLGHGEKGIHTHEVVKILARKKY